MKRWREGEAPHGVAELLRAHDSDPEPASGERVWRRLQSLEQRHSSAKAWGWAGGSLLAAAILMLVLWTRGEDEPAIRVRFAEGLVWAEEQTVETGQRLEPPLELRTSPGAFVELEAPDGDRLWLQAGAGLIGEAPTRWVLTRGQAEVWARAEASEVPLALRAGPWSMTALSSRFQVERFDDGRVRVAVRKGELRLEGPDETAVLQAGQVFDERKTTETLPDESVPVAPPPVQESPAASTSMREPPRPKPRPSRASKAAPRSDAPPLMMPEETLNRAKASADVEEAVALFDEVADHGPPLDEIAAFRAAQRLREAGRREEALSRLKVHLTRWPSGELTELAWRDLARMQLEDGEASQAQQTLRDYGLAYPASMAQPEVAFLEGEVERGLEAYEKAAAAYEKAARAPHLLERASFLRGLCLAKAGRDEAARKALRAFLTLHPAAAEADLARRILGEEKKSEGHTGVESFTDTQKEGFN